MPCRLNLPGRARSLWAKESRSWRERAVVCLKFWDLVVVILLLLNLRHHYIYYKTVLTPPDGDDWWRWPVYEGWSILGKVPRFNDEDGHVDAVSAPKLVRYPNKPQRNKEKLILFHHFPMETVSHIVDPLLCGGVCFIAYNDSTSTPNMEPDAVVFSLNFPKSLPKRRSPTQLYVWMIQESPSSTLYSRTKDSDDNYYFNDTKNMFNLTMTYRRDSDVYLPYNTSYNVQQAMMAQTPVFKAKDLLNGKKRLAAWASGNCGYTKGSSFRVLLMMRLLNQGLKVDVYGLCVYWSLPGTWMDMAQHLGDYKFYFSFENAFHCRDYVTEKTWFNALSAGVVPVIWGPLRKDVEAVLPEKSFIFVEDYKTERELIDHLVYLDKNDDKYLKYFEWRLTRVKLEIPGRKNEGKPWLTSKVTGLCQLCYILHDDDKHQLQFGTRPQRIVNSIYKWWYINETKTCLSPYAKRESSLSQTYNWLLLAEVWFGVLSHFRFYTLLQVVIVVTLVSRRLKFL